MKNINLIGKVIAIIIAISYYLFFENIEAFQLVIFSGVIIIIGIPHGAIDHLLPQGKEATSSLMVFLARYLGIMLIYLCTWYFFPKLSLIVFLAISAYHFGQTHFVNHSVIKFRSLCYFILGSNFLGIILLSDFQTTEEILSSIADVSFIEPYRYPFMLSLFFVSFILTLIQTIERKSILLIEITLLSVFLYFTPLLLSFGLYFGFWHSLPSLLIEFEEVSRDYSKEKLKKFVLHLMPFSIISIFGIIFILILSNNYLQKDQMILLFFILVSLISAPHIFVMNKFIESRKIQN
ncbi:Brp/Blh family beta-carotene 15,15'-dioxygenase [Belliella sp. R4-6]|uniref:Probable beta-carotene 15,15'-dioxygenase n=1 Tax=Belliella alkalica TaxID=1730871 RepID=A0ABS9V7M6_9BACT|nr:Brp/Blh family beta-carotene 15,15'-dioxygenase [Belliella alkalica]MCH7411953.1 Brp/Blh family beta-carotene 15,15'-dioxygenase [Belliella alkalica]